MFKILVRPLNRLPDGDHEGTVHSLSRCGTCTRESYLQINSYYIRSVRIEAVLLSIHNHVLLKTHIQTTLPIKRHIVTTPHLRSIQVEHQPIGCRNSLVNQTVKPFMARVAHTLIDRWNTRPAILDLCAV